MDYQSLRPSQIVLDPQNPRLPDGTSNDKEAINRLLAEGYTQLLALARDLVERGEANPTELPIVMPQGAKYLVLEGNRRVAALKLLGDPRLADDSRQRAAFERLRSSRKHQPPTTLYCAVAEDRDEADPWITLRHTGANDGVGVRVWSAEQNARHRRRMQAPIDSGTVRAIAIADDLTEAYQADDALVELIRRVRASKLTNIGRFFSGVVLTRMQFVLKQSEDGESQSLWAKHTADQLHDYFFWAFTFLDANSVDAFKNDGVRNILLNENGDLLPDVADSLREHRRLADQPYSPEPASMVDDGDGDEDDDGREASASDDDDDASLASESGSPGSSSAGAGSAGGNNGANSQGVGTPPAGAPTQRRDQPDERVLYSKVRLPNLSPNIQRLLKEARQLPIDDNYAVACVLARVILELAVSDPDVLAWSGKKENDTLAKKIRGCILKLDPQIDTPQRTRQDLVQANLEVQNIGVVYMHQFMHNSAAKADPHLARRFSSVYTPLLKSINGALQ